MNVNNRWSHQSHSDGLSSPVYHSPYPTDNPRLSPSIQSGFVKQYPIVNDIPTYTLPLGAQVSLQFIKLLLFIHDLCLQ